MSTDALNILIGFGGVFLLGVIGFIFVWFSPRSRHNKTPTDETPIQKLG